MIRKLWIPMALVLMVAACTRPVINPTVLNTSPVAGASDVSVDTEVSATFNVLVRTNTLDSGFTLATSGGAAVAGDVAFDVPSRTATFTPDAPLAYSTTYVATVASTVTSTSGGALGETFSWSFQTEADPDGATPVAVSVTIDQGNQTFVVDDAGAQLTATVDFGDGPEGDDSVTWASDDADVATVDADGFLTVVGVGNTIITATSVETPSVSGTITVTVTTEPGPVAVSVTIDQGNQTFVVGDAGLQLTASVDFGDGPEGDDSVTWASDDEDVAEVDADGSLTVVGVGSTVIRATSVETPSVSGTITVTVVAAPGVYGVTIDQDDQELLIGEELELTATVIAVGVDDSVEWASDDDDIATVDPATGVVTAVGAGSVEITATSTFDDEFSDTITITVPAQVVNSVSIDQGEEDGSLSVAVDVPFTLTVTVDVSGGAPETVEWEIDNDLVATLDVDPETGVVTVTPLLADSAAMITVTSTFDPAASDEIVIYVSEILSVDIDGDPILYLLEGATTTLTAVVGIDGPGSGDVTWSSSDPEVVEIDEETGELTVVGTSDAPVTITASSVMNPAVSDTVEVYVLDEDVLLSVVGDYEEYEDLAHIDTEIDLAFPAISGGVGDLTYTLVSGALPADFITVTGLIVPLPTATYSVTLDETTGAISGSTGFPGVFTGTVQVEDEIGQTATAEFTLELGVSLLYTQGLGEGTPPNIYTYVAGTPPVDGEFVVPGDRVQLSGVENTDFLPVGFLDDFDFALEFVVAGVGTPDPGMFVINPNEGNIRRMLGSVGVSYLIYDVILTYDDGEYQETVEYEVRFRRTTENNDDFPDREDD